MEKSGTAAKVSGVQPNRHALALFFLVTGVAFFAGCDRRQQVRYYHAPKDRAYAEAAGLREAPTFAAPPGWTAGPAGESGEVEFEISNLKSQISNLKSDTPSPHAAPSASPSAASSASASAALTPLGPHELQEAIEQSGQQLGLDLKDYEQLAPRLANIQIAGNPAFVFDLASPDGARRIILTAIDRGGLYWVVSLRGAASAVEAQRAAYNSLTKSLHFALVAAKPEAPAAPEATFKAPPGWQEQQPRPMSFANFSITSGEQHAEVAITRMRRAGFEQMKLMNINRWRGQVGLPDVANPDAMPPRPIDMAGGKGLLLDLTGPPAPGAQAARMLVTWYTVGDDLWFIKLQGPADLVAAQQPAFEQFIQSIRFGGEVH